MSDADRLLEWIETAVVEHGGDLGGWTHRGEGELKLFDGRVTLRSEVRDMDPPRGGVVHTHVITTLHEHDDESLDACVIGMGDDRPSALAQAAGIWLTAVAGPIRSYLDGRPICMTCQAGVTGGDPARGFMPGDYGLSGMRAFVGPAIARGFTGEFDHSAINDTRPWFRFAAESAAPRRVHLAKATVLKREDGVWARDLEVDGHDVSHHEENWPAGVSPPGIGYLTRFAVFEFPRESSELARRGELERAIHHFAARYAAHSSIDSLMQEMVDRGWSEDLAQEVESFSTIAFGRLLFEPLGVQYAPTVIRARRDGRVETDVPLMSLPSYNRARAIGAKLRETMPSEEFQALALYNAESHSIVQLLEAGGESPDLSNCTLFPNVVPDAGVSQETMDAALAMLRKIIDRDSKDRKKPWWKFW